MNSNKQRWRNAGGEEARKTLYNEPFLLSPLQFLHNVYSKLRLLYQCTAEAEQVVTKDSSKNRSSAFPRPRVAGLFSLLLHFSAGLTAQHLELWSFQPLPCCPFVLGQRRNPWWNTEIWYIELGLLRICNSPPSTNIRYVNGYVMLTKSHRT